MTNTDLKELLDALHDKYNSPGPAPAMVSTVLTTSP